MDENDPIYKAIDRYGGHECDIPGVVRGLTEAGYEIRKVPVPGASDVDRVIQAARDLVAQGPELQQPASRSVINMLAVAWCEAVRGEWRDFVAANDELTAQIEVARELMRADGYVMENEPICGLPGVPVQVAKFDGRDCYCIDHSMVQVTPLSAIYVNRVREVMNAAATVSKRLAEEAAKDPNTTWPIRTAAGEVFNSIEEMEASPNEFVRGLAASMRAGAVEREKMAAKVFNGDAAKS